MLKPLHKFCRIALLFFFYLVLTGLLLPEARVFGQLTQLSGAQTRILTNVQSGTTYTILATDCGKLISFSNSGSIAVTLPQAGAGGLAAGCWMDIQNLGSGPVTLTPVTSSIDQASSLQLTINQGLRLVSTGTGYLTQRGQGSGTGGGTGTGTVTGSTGALASSAIVTGNGGTDIKTPVPAATMDNGGNISIPGTLTTNTACNGCAGAIDLPAGTDPGANQLANSFSWMAPPSMGASYRWKVPAADAAGAIVSDGAATPGTLSIVPLSGTGNIAATTSPVITTATLVQPVLSNYTVGTLPAGVTPGKLAYVTDGSTATDCTVGGGSRQLLCAFNGSVWAFPGPGNTRRVCSIIIGADNGVALAAGDIAPQGMQCQIPAASSVIEIDVAADSGTPAVVVDVNHAGTQTNLSTSLATAAAGGRACANATGSGTGIDGITTCSIPLTATTLAAGDWLETHTSAGASTAKRMSISVVYTVNN
jgi:hypothetical protein